MLNIGCHLSSVRGYEAMGKEALSIGANTFQFFTRNPRGGKAKELDVINEHKPNNIQRYFEPFVGGGSVFFDIDIDDSYINDLSSDLILLYTLIQNKNAVFLDKLKKLYSYAF